MNTQEKTQELTKEIKRLQAIADDESKPSMERLEAREEARKLTREINDLLMKGFENG